MPKPMSRTAAKRQAHRESHLFRSGREWCLIAFGLFKSDRLPYAEARRELADWRAKRVRELIGAGS